MGTPIVIVTMLTWLKECMLQPWCWLDVLWLHLEGRPRPANHSCGTHPIVDKSFLGESFFIDLNNKTNDRKILWYSKDWIPKRPEKQFSVVVCEEILPTSFIVFIGGFTMKFSVTFIECLASCMLKKSLQRASRSSRSQQSDPELLHVRARWVDMVFGKLSFSHSALAEWYHELKTECDIPFFVRGITRPV